MMLIKTLSTARQLQLMRIAPCILSTCLASGAFAGNDDDDVQSTTLAITGSAKLADSDSNPSWPSVVRWGGAGTCTGTLISPVHVLTAGHCIGPGNWVQLDASAGNGWGPLWLRWIKIFSDADAIKSRATWSGADLQVSLLTRAVRPGAVGTPTYGLSVSNIAIGVSSTTPHTAIGYGQVESPNGCVDNRLLRRHGVVITGPVIVADGLRLRNGSVFSWEQSGFCMTGANSPGAAEGDSGGPLFDSAGQIVGVFSSAAPWRDPRNGNVISSASGTARPTFEWTNVTLAENRNWIMSQLRGDWDNDGISDIRDQWPADHDDLHIDEDGDGVIVPYDYRDNHYDPFNLKRISDGPGPHDGEWVAELFAAVL